MFCLGNGTVYGNFMGANLHNLRNINKHFDIISRTACYENEQMDVQEQHMMSKISKVHIFCGCTFHGAVVQGDDRQNSL